MKTSLQNKKLVIFDLMYSNLEPLSAEMLLRSVLLKKGNLRNCGLYTLSQLVNK